MNRRKRFANTSATLLRSSAESKCILRMTTSNRAVGSTFFSLYLYGEDLDTLKKLAREAETRIAKVKGVEDVGWMQTPDARKCHMVLNRDKAMKAGITPQQLSQIMMFCLAGNVSIVT